MPRAFACSALLLVLFAARASPQPPAASQTTVVLPPMAADADPAFEVTTIRPSKPGNGSQGFHIRGRELFLEDEPVISLISVAYSVHKDQILGAPAWFSTDPYDVVGVPDVPGEPGLKQMQLMIQKLLSDRFGLRFHHEKRELPVYAIIVAKGGPKLTAHTVDEAGLPDENGWRNGSVRTLEFTNFTIADFALDMELELTRPIVDQTGLAGAYNFKLQWTADEAHLIDPNAPPGLFTAIQEQLGLKLEPKKAAIDVLVIDHAERPSEN